MLLDGQSQPLELPVPPHPQPPRSRRQDRPDPDLAGLRLVRVLLTLLAADPHKRRGGADEDGEEGVADPVYLLYVTGFFR